MRTRLAQYFHVGTRKELFGGLPVFAFGRMVLQQYGGRHRPDGGRHDLLHPPGRRLQHAPGRVQLESKTGVSQPLFGGCDGIRAAESSRLSVWSEGSIPIGRSNKLAESIASSWVRPLPNSPHDAAEFFTSIRPQSSAAASAPCSLLNASPGLQSSPCLS